MKTESALVFVKNDTPLTTSRIVAEKFDKPHDNVLKAIRRIGADLGDAVTFDGMFHETTYADKYGREKPMYTITRDGFSLLAMGFTGKKALQFKLKFIDAFNRMEETLREIVTNPQLIRDKRWTETRQGTKISHRPFTDAIKLLIEYLRRNGETREDGYIYGHLTNVIQNAVGVKRGERDNTPVATLNKLDQVQNMTANLILQILSLRQDVKTLAQVEAAILLQLQTFNRLLGGQSPLLLDDDR